MTFERPISIISYTSITSLTKGAMKMKSIEKNGNYMGSVKVGPKGQIVIPKEVREMFAINPGDTLILLADAEKGIAIERYSTFAKIADAIFEGKSKDLYPDQSEAASKEFASAIQALEEGDEYHE